MAKTMLTKNFSLEEMERSNRANALRISNRAGKEQVANLTQLCQKVLQPLREHFNTPIRVTSGYRCPLLNEKVGGVANSQHMLGEAADITGRFWEYTPRIDQLMILVQWAAWIMQHCMYDQVILEDDGTSFWLHVSCKHDVKNNRMQFRTIGINTQPLEKKPVSSEA